MKTILNTELIVAKDYQEYTKTFYTNSDFDIGRRIDNQNLRRNFVENLLLYDKVIVATKSFDEIMTLRNWMGGDSIEQLLRDGVLSFAQTPFTWTYIQKWKHEQGQHTMHGIANVFLADKNLYNLLPSSGSGNLKENELSGWSSPDLEKAVEYTLTTFYNFNPKKVGKFARLVAKNTTRLNTDEFRGFITNKSDEDLKNVELRRKLNFDNEVDIENIPDNSPDIRRLFRIVMANQNIAISKYFDDSDVIAEEFYSDVLESKLEGELRSQNINLTVNNLFSFARLPTPEVFSSDKFLTIPQIIKIRNSKEGVDFRKWIHKKINKEENVKEAYIDLLKKEKKYTWSIRTLSFITPEVIASFISKKINTPLVPGLAGSLTNEFLISPLIKRYININPPKTIIERLNRDIDARNLD